jgi:hypothetical protein
VYNTQIEARGQSKKPIKRSLMLCYMISLLDEKCTAGSLFYIQIILPLEVMSTLEAFVYVREQVEEKLCLTPGNVSMSKSTVADHSRYGKT